eukprot:3783671-Amphidinium_carterae.1
MAHAQLDHHVEEIFGQNGHCQQFKCFVPASHHQDGSAAYYMHMDQAKALADSSNLQLTMKMTTVGSCIFRLMLCNQITLSRVPPPALAVTLRS